MTASEFFEKAEEILERTKGADAIAVEFFIQDIEALSEEWEAPDDDEDGS